MRTFLITEVRGNHPTEIVIVTDDILVRKELGRFQIDSAHVVFATFANLFKSLGFDVNVQVVEVLNPNDHVRKWQLDYDPDDVIPNTRRITIE